VLTNKNACSERINFGLSKSCFQLVILKASIKINNFFTPDKWKLDNCPIFESNFKHKYAFDESQMNAIRVLNALIAM